jgi:hypothetical protein
VKQYQVDKKLLGDLEVIAAGKGRRAVKKSAKGHTSKR